MLKEAITRAAFRRCRRRLRSARERHCVMGPGVLAPDSPWIGESLPAKSAGFRQLRKSVRETNRMVPRNMAGEKATVRGIAAMFSLANTSKNQGTP